MNVPMKAPHTAQHDLVAMTAALRRALLQRVEGGIEASGLKNYLMYLLAKRLTLAGPMTAAAMSSELRQEPREVTENLARMEQQALVRREGDGWQITDAGRAAMVAANDSGGHVLSAIRSDIGVQACDQLVAGMRDALAALQKATVKKAA